MQSRHQNQRGAKPDHPPDSTRANFERDSKQTQPNILRELWDFLRHEKKWWLAPIIVVLLLVGLLILLSGSAAAPFIYPLF